MGANGRIYNEGVNGFHIWTIVTDGYGNFIAEDMHGNEIARVATTGETNRDHANDLGKLVLAAMRVEDPELHMGEVPTAIEVR